MGLIELTHAKVIWASVGAQHPWSFFFNNDSKNKIVWYLIDFNFSMWYIWDCLYLLSS